MSETFRFTPPPQPAPVPERPEEVDREPEHNPHARLDYLHAVNPPKKKRLWLRIVLLLLLLAVLAAGGIFAYPKLMKRHATTAPKTTPTHAASTPTPATTKVATKHYDSTNFNLGFEYPATWTVTDTAGTAGRLTVASPATDQKTAAGATQLVRTVMTIAAKGQNLTPFDKGSALAVRTSEKIKYVSPTSVQRGETYLAFIQYSATPAGDGLDGIYITGDNGYQKDQYIPKTDMTGRDPLIAVTFENCTNATCSGTPTPVSLPSSVWDNAAFKTPILTLLTSLALN